MGDLLSSASRLFLYLIALFHQKDKISLGFSQPEPGQNFYEMPKAEFKVLEKGWVKDGEELRERRKGKKFFSENPFSPSSAPHAEEGLKG